MCDVGEEFVPCVKAQCWFVSEGNYSQIASPSPPLKENGNPASECSLIFYTRVGGKMDGWMDERWVDDEIECRPPCQMGQFLPGLY